MKMQSGRFFLSNFTGYRSRSNSRKPRAPLPPDMANHMSKIDGIWHCITCNNTKFRDKTDLRRHVEAKHLPATLRYKCNLCGYVTKTSYYFRKHQLMHEKEDALKAEVEDAPFADT